MKRTALFTIVALATLVFASAAFAGAVSTSNAAGNIQATVAANCTVAAFGINFGPYDPLVTNATTDLDNSSNKVNVTCTKGSVPVVSLSNGSNYAAGARYMKSAATGATLHFDIFTDGTYGTQWNATNTVSATSTTKNSPVGGGFTLYGRVFAGQDVAVANDYKETIDATINF